ncbi:MAG TPA: hypothetical protein VM529_03530 [Gemmata sp.]|jgi:hypothetical protein|nr:hypothetical protein [Gemmata sp.]
MADTVTAASPEALSRLSGQVDVLIGRVDAQSVLVRNVAGRCDSLDEWSNEATKQIINNTGSIGRLEDRIRTIEDKLNPPPPPPVAKFLGRILSGEAGWRWNEYGGADGYNLFGAVAVNSPIASWAFGILSHVWAPNTGDKRAVRVTDKSAIAACRYMADKFAFTVQKTGLLSLYFLDWDRNGREQLVEIVDLNTLEVLDAQTVASFENGAMLQWETTRSVGVRITKTKGTNGVISAVLLGGPVEVDWQEGPPPPAADWDSAFVSQSVPTILEADQVFKASVTLRNTGAKQWGMLSGAQEPPILVATGDSWGTDFVILGQGRFIDNGQEAAFVSHLRAPSDPGTYTFRWRLGHPSAGGFGVESDPVTITVTPATHRPLVLPTPMTDDDGRAPLTPDRVEYLGSFKLPKYVGGANSGYSETTMALKEVNGVKRLVIGYNHPRHWLFEVNIPDPVKYTGSNLHSLPTAPLANEWGDVSAGGIGPVGQAYYRDGFLHWSWHHPYWTGGPIKCAGRTLLREDGTFAPAGTWEVPNQKWHWGGTHLLPKSYADKYTGGRRDARGFGCYYSISDPCSRGVALGVFDDPDPSLESLVRRHQLLGRLVDNPLPRRGDYFNANCDYWAEQPESADKGFVTFDDHCRAGLVVHLPDVQGAIFPVRVGTGRLGYDYGSITRGGGATDWYFFDAHDIGSTPVESDDLPHAIDRDVLNPYGSGQLITSLAQDGRVIYALRGQAYQNGTEYDPLVDVFRIRE